MVVPRIEGKRIYVLSSSLRHQLRFEYQLRNRKQGAALFSPLEESVLDRSPVRVTLVLELQAKRKFHAFGDSTLFELVPKEIAIFDQMKPGNGGVKEVKVFSVGL